VPLSDTAGHSVSAVPQARVSVPSRLLFRSFSLARSPCPLSRFSLRSLHLALSRKRSFSLPLALALSRSLALSHSLLIAALHINIFLACHQMRRHLLTPLLLFAPLWHPLHGLAAPHAFSYRRGLASEGLCFLAPLHTSPQIRKTFAQKESVPGVSVSRVSLRCDQDKGVSLLLAILLSAFMLSLIFSRSTSLVCIYLSATAVAG